MAATYPPIPTEHQQGAKYSDYLYNVLVDYGNWVGENSVFNFDYSGLGLDDQAVADLIVMWYENYYFYEIGFGTPQMFRHYVKVRWQQLVEAYAKKFDALLHQYPKLYQTKTETYHDSANTNTSSADSDTPQSKIDPVTDFVSFKTESNANSSLDHTMSGYDGRTEVEMWNEYMDSTRSLKREFIEEFHNLFMTIF